MTELRAPFIWFGGKRRQAGTIWKALGRDVPNYVEPFAGSLAVLLARPGGPGKIETVNDKFGALPNFWRAIKLAPEAVAEWCDFPVSEMDMHARNRWIISRLREIESHLRTDPDYFDAKVAGWWCWGQCCWIGGGWAIAEKPLTPPHLGVNGPGVGVHSTFARRLPSIGNDRGINGVAAPPTIEWFRALSERLRGVHIVAGDWTRVLGNSTLGKGKNVGGRKPTALFFDPPYARELRDSKSNMYGEDEPGLSYRVREWALEHGDDPDLRICLAGYFEEHAEHMPSTWTVHRWKGARGYAGEDNDNREKETLWFSPHCLPLDQQRSLFDQTITAP